MICYCFDLILWLTRRRLIYKIYTNFVCVCVCHQNKDNKKKHHFNSDRNVAFFKFATHHSQSKHQKPDALFVELLSNLVGSPSACSRSPPRHPLLHLHCLKNKSKRKWVSLHLWIKCCVKMCDVTFFFSFHFKGREPIACRYNT